MRRGNESIPDSKDAGMSRRKFLGKGRDVAALVLTMTSASAAVTYLAMRPESEREKIAKLNQEFERRREAIVNEYVRTGTVRDQKALRELVLLQELLDYLRVSPQGNPDEFPVNIPIPSSIEDFLANQYAPFAKAVQAEFRLKQEDSRHALGESYTPFHELVDLKQGLEEHQGANTVYNGRYNSPYYGMFRCRDGVIRVQCSGNSRLLLLLAHEAEIGEQLVGIYSHGHFFPGNLSGDGVLSSVEMTKKGPAQTVLGSLEDLRQNPDYQLRVAKAGDIFALGVIDDPQVLRKLQRQHLLLDNTPMEREGPVAGEEYPFNVKRGDPLAFGIPEGMGTGDQPMETTNVVDNHLYTVRGNVYSGKGRGASTRLLPGDFTWGTYGVEYQDGQFLDAKTKRILSEDEAWAIRKRNRAQENRQSQGRVIVPGSPDDPTKMEVDFKKK